METTKANVSVHDPYVVGTEKIQDPPTSFRGKLKYLGPGFILSASIVGSGELIATTTLGAQAGFVTFWVIFVSCLVKVAIQVEYGKFAILSGKSVLDGYNTLLPGPRIGKAHWTVWSWIVLMAVKLLQLGGIVGGVAIILHIVFPLLPVAFWAFFAAIVVALLVFRGLYSFIEKFSLVLMGLFTLFTFACLFALQYTEYSISFAEIAEGFTFQLPAAYIFVVVGAFGITGVGGDEIMYYNYWCIEKGYAAYTGPNDGSDSWRKRAKGWIGIMYFDAILAMVGYTIVTAAFYLLGAAILHAQGEVPKGYDMVETLSVIYTESLGPWARNIFLAGGVIVLFSTLFAALASWVRVWTDSFGKVGWIDFFNLEERKRTIAILSWAFPVAWAAFFLLFESPVWMVLTGGVITSIILFIVVYASLYFRRYRIRQGMHASTFYEVAFWLSTAVILVVGIYGVVKLF